MERRGERIMKRDREENEEGVREREGDKEGTR